jgi:hypothetical protein
LSVARERGPRSNATTLRPVASAPDPAQPARLRVALLGADARGVAAFAQALRQAIDAIDAPRAPGSLQRLRLGPALLLEPQPADLRRAAWDAALLLDHKLPPQRDAELRQALAAHGQPWSVVHGEGAEALEAALDAVTFWLLRQPHAAPALSGLFARLDRRDAAQPAWRWSCDGCDSPECEHQSLAATR